MLIKLFENKNLTVKVYSVKSPPIIGRSIIQEEVELRKYKATPIFVDSNNGGG